VAEKCRKTQRGEGEKNQALAYDINQNRETWRREVDMTTTGWGQWVGTRDNPFALFMIFLIFMEKKKSTKKMKGKR